LFIREEDAMSRTIKALRLLVIGVFCTALLVLPVPRASAVSMTYDILLALIIVACLPLLEEANLPPASGVVADQLLTAVEGARAANIVGNSTAELTRLSKAIGAAQALMGMTAACDDCSDLRVTLQQIIGQAAVFKTRIVGASSTCNPNGIVQGNEQCDPLAIPSGCPASPTAATYCSDECRCEASIIP
jgi:hypothetical protein